MQKDLDTKKMRILTIKYGIMKKMMLCLFKDRLFQNPIKKARLHCSSLAEKYCLIKRILNQFIVPLNFIRLDRE
jgi:hypothetical protein